MNWKQKLENIFEQTLRQDFSNSLGESLFNFYAQENPVLDIPKGSCLRWRNLRNYIYSFPKKPEFLLVGEAPGARGCRFSGIPFTSEKLIVKEGIPVQGMQSSQNPIPLSENTATIFWKIMKPYAHSFFVWNVVPLHPHQPNNPMKNRSPNKKEIYTFLRLLLSVIEVISPKKVVAIGKTAYQALSDTLKIHCVYIRHPSYGGKKEFQDQILKLFASQR